MVQFVSSNIERFREEQNRRLGKLATRASNAKRDVDAGQGDRCGRDSMGKEGWPPPASQKVEQKECDLNELRCLIDNDGALIAKCMDNGLVLLVSTLCAIGKSIKVDRKKSRIALKNKGHVEKVWGKAHRAKIFIPLLVHHYNQ
eukprot:12661584-Ditylum_brightwellii.AAC.1